MVKIENRCSNCAVPPYPCLGNACSLRHVKVFYCDRCHEEIDGEVYDDGEELCESCLLHKYRKEC